MTGMLKLFRDPRSFCFFCQLLYVHAKLLHDGNSFNCVFRHSAECVLGHRCGQFSQRTGTDQGTLPSKCVFFSECLKSQNLRSSTQNKKMFPLFCTFSTSFISLTSFLPNLCRMSRRKRRLPVRRSPCRKPRRWLKSAHCLLPTSPLQREFLSLLLSFLLAVLKH